MHGRQLALVPATRVNVSDVVPGRRAARVGVANRLSDRGRRIVGPTASQRRQAGRMIAVRLRLHRGALASASQRVTMCPQMTMRRQLLCLLRSPRSGCVGPLRPPALAGTNWFRFGENGSRCRALHWLLRRLLSPLQWVTVRRRLHGRGEAIPLPPPSIVLASVAIFRRRPTTSALLSAGAFVVSGHSTMSIPRLRPARLAAIVAVLPASARGLARGSVSGRIVLFRRPMANKLLLYMRFIINSARQLRRPHSPAASCRRAGKER